MLQTQEDKPYKGQRYKVGDTVQFKHQQDGELTIVAVEARQFRWFPPTPYYILSNGKGAHDENLW